jgi:hypothetical protein
MFRYHNGINPVAAGSLLVEVAAAAELKARQRLRSLALVQKLLHHKIFLKVVNFTYGPG